MDIIREQLARQSLLLEFISECVSLQSVPDLIELIATRLHWICDFDSCSALLPDTQGLSLWSQDRKARATSQIEEGQLRVRHAMALDDVMFKGLPRLAHYDNENENVYLAALPLGSGTVVHGALCIGRASGGFSQADVRHLQQASNAIGSALTRIALFSAEKKAIAALQESEIRYRTLFDSIDEGFCIIQFIDGPHGRLSDYIHLEANPAYMRHAGIADIVGKTCRGELTEKEADAWVLMLRAVLETGKPARFERLLEATSRYLEVVCSPVEPATKNQVAIVFQDISARKQAERMLYELNKTLESQVAKRTAERDRMWNNSPDLMLVINFDGYFQQVNPAWTALLGYERVELIGRHVNEFVIQSDHASTVEAYEVAAVGGRPKIENRYRHKDGSIRWLSWVAAPAGEMTYATGRDITAEKERVAALEQTQQALRQSQKMEAVGQLTGGLAHDFNNLLGAISGSLELLKRKTQGDPTIGRYVDIGQTATKRAAALTHRLLAFSRQQTLEPKVISVNRLIADFEVLIRRTLGPEIFFEAVTGIDIWPVCVDPSQLENAVLNLCINARDAMPDGGRLVVETANRSLDEHTASALQLIPGQFVSVCVSDDGTGMPANVTARAFDPFFTTKPIGLGTGLGLSMVYGFAHQSGGHARIYSEEGSGTNVCMYLPRHHGELDAVENNANQVQALTVTDAGETVLVVDDEASVRTLMVEVLNELGYRVLEAEDGPGAIKILQANRFVKLLVTDVGLPGGMNGRQVADAARLLIEELQVLFVTGYAENAALSHGHLPLGMQVLTKPFELSAFGQRVQTLVSSTKASNAL